MEKLAASDVVKQLVSKIFGQISRASSSQQKRGEKFLQTYILKLVVFELNEFKRKIIQGIL